MLIQCHSCNTKYRLNLERIPRRKTFVRCKNCGTPIFIDPTEEEETKPGVLPPQETGPSPEPPETTAGAAGTGAVLQPEESGAGEPRLVECPSCLSRYRVPGAALSRPRLKLKCTQCGHVFQPPSDGEAAAATSGAPSFFPRAAFPQDAPPAGREMPVPDDQRMDSMFDDLKAEPPPAPPRDTGPGPESLPPEEELGRIADSVFADDESPDDPERAYREATAFGDEELPQPPKARGTVPDEQKYRFFLDPKRYQENQMADDKPRDGGTGERTEEALPHPDELDDLPPLDEPPAATPRTDVPPPPAAEPPPAPDRAEPPPPMEVAQPAEGPAHHEVGADREAVPGQTGPRAERRVQWLLTAAAVLVLAATGAWGYQLATAEKKAPFVVQPGVSHQLTLSNDLDGRYIQNGPSGKRLFVVSGSLQHEFPPGSRVRWIRIKGVVYSDNEQQQPLDTAYAYVGNRLSAKQLAEWDLDAIRAYYGYANGREDANYDIPPQSSVSYQLVFTQANGNVQRTVAEVVSYHRDGQAVFVSRP